MKMIYNINDGRYSTSEVEETFGQQVDVLNISEFNEGKGPDYAYWGSITHPETGESLNATRGYIGRNNKCYYAEYQGSDGRYYNYTLGMKGESIGRQQSEDNAKRETAVKNDEARKTFSDIMSSHTGVSALDNTAVRETARRNYTDMMNGGGVDTHSKSVIQTHSNGRHK